MAQTVTRTLFKKKLSHCFKCFSPVLSYSFFCLSSCSQQITYQSKTFSVISLIFLDHTTQWGCSMFVGQTDCWMVSPCPRSAQWAASSSCACFLTRLKGRFCCFWHLAILQVTPTLQRWCQAGGKKLVTWPLGPCPRPPLPRWQQKVCRSGATPGCRAQRSLWCHDRHALWGEMGSGSFCNPFQQTC